ncbi:hypothetical protein BH23ACT3_BH23ACT3_23610 [soil metagenome]
MPLLEPIPLTVVAGGPEMRSLLHQLVDLGVDIAVVTPESVGAVAAPGCVVYVAADVASRSPGCPCCRVRIDLVDALATLVRRRARPTHVLVAVPDQPGEPVSSSVVAVVHTVLSDPDLRRWVRLDGVVATLDAVSAVTRLRTGTPVVDETGAERLAMADRVLVARADQVVEESLVDLRDVVRHATRIATVLAPAVERVAAAQVLPIDAWHGAPQVIPSTGHNHGPTGTMSCHPDTVVIEQRGLLDPGGVEAWLDEVLSRHAPRLLRLQGVLAVDGSPSRVCCHGVGSFAMSHPERGHVRGPFDETSLMVVIGHGLPADELAAGLRATAVR